MSLVITEYCVVCDEEQEAVINEDGESECAECGSLL